MKRAYLDAVGLIDERRHLHERRARKIHRIIAERPRTAFEVAQAMWGDVAITQAYLTLSEVLGHTDLLVNDGLVAEVLDLERREQADVPCQRIALDGDLVVEVGHAAVPALQKHMIRLAREMDKVVITATQMMESMINNPVPTRAEVSDVANAVLDGSDAVMLSAETAAGDYPLETVEAMARVCLGAERERAGGAA